MLQKPYPPEIVHALALAYQQTFGGEPWNEGYVCSHCGNVFPLTPRPEMCVTCSSDSVDHTLTEYWPTEKIISDFLNEMSKPGSVCIITQDCQKIVGFAWGYTLLSDVHLDQHLDAPGVHHALSGEYFYLDEVGLIPEYQKKGLGTKMVEKIVRAQKHDRVILRTKDGGSMFKIVTHMGGGTIQKISKGRVIMSIFLVS